MSSSMTFETMGDEGLRDRVGKMVDVYDGRKWPVVRVASLYIHPVDNVHKVTQAVLSEPTVGKRKWRANKYTVAVGTTHGHVQVFLTDNDLVLKALQQCTAEEKCLLLIKKPKDTSKKLLKTQSLNNLSMSDTQLYKHKHDLFSALFTSNKTKGQLSTVSENQKSKKKVTKKPQVNTFVPIPELGIYTPEQHVLQNGTYAQYCHLFREVNNNNANNVKNYENLPSKSDIVHASNSSFSSTLDDSSSSYGFGQRETAHFVNPGLKHNKFDDAYHSCIDLSQPVEQHAVHAYRQHQPEKPPREKGQPLLRQIKEEQGNLEPTSRSHSLGDLTTGLTFSLVGQQHKVWSEAEEHPQNRNIKNISKEKMAASKDFTTSNRSVPSPHRSTANNKNVVASKPFDKDQYKTESANNQLTAVKRPFQQEKFPFQRQNSAPEVIKPQLSIFQTEVRMESEQPDYRPRASKAPPNRDQNCGEKNFEQNWEPKAPVIRQPLLNNWQSNNQNQAPCSKADRNSVREMSPMKPKRSLPVVPAADTSERVKRLTDVMKSRIASGSSRSHSQGRPTSDSTSTHTNMSGRSYSETNSDSDVFVDTPGQFFRTSERNHYSDSAAVHRSPKGQPRSAVSDGGGSKIFSSDQQSFRSYDMAMIDSYCPQSPMRKHGSDQESSSGKSCYKYNFNPPCLDQQMTSQADRSSDSAQTPVTNNSHNGSIMDSGYTTNNESDSFSSAQRGHYNHPYFHPSASSPHDYDNVVSQHSPVMLLANPDTQPKCYQIYNTAAKKQSNLVFSRQFGSVQNVSSNDPVENSHHSTHRDINALLGYKSQQSGDIQYSAARKAESRRLTLDGSFYPSQNGNKFRDPTYTNTVDSNKMYINGHSSNGIVKKMHEDYHSNESMHSRVNSNGHHPGTVSGFSILTQKENSDHKYRNNSDSDSNYVNQEFIKPQDNRNKSTYVQGTNNKQDACDSPVIKYDEDSSCQNFEPWNAYLYRKTPGKRDDGPVFVGSELKPKPVPIAGRPPRVHTLPGGFRLTELDRNLPPSPKFSMEFSLFQLLQTCDLLPLTIHLPDHIPILTMLRLSETSISKFFTSIPDSQKGRTANIGSPGSAFTPVKVIHEQNGHGKSCSKLVCASQVSKDLQNFTVFGTLLEGDILVEVNDSLCLDANVHYLDRMLRCCGGSVTFTVARPRLTKDNMAPVDSYAQAQRIKSLEAEISRLDDIIQLRDERIKDLTSRRGTVNYQRGATSDISRAIEGMVIGDDEYVV
ncbi:hypothetical protein Btru_047242 [Bulinus truncatus]|nr:hypothetical protein Btru_047242 [Bulinus truncatus]